MENKTAVEFLVDKLNNYFGNNDFIITYQNEISKALEIEKQQIIDAVNIPKEQRWYEDKYNSCGEQYYSETYNKPT